MSLGCAQVRQLALVLLAFRLGVLPAEQAAPLKLLEKGVSKEALAGLVRSFSVYLCFSFCYKVCCSTVAGRAGGARDDGRSESAACAACRCCWSSR